MQLIFATGNTGKFRIAEATSTSYGIKLIQNRLNIDEVQGEDSEYIIRNKAKQAFSILNAPVVVSDDSWSIPGLRGFPGPYMKSMNHWLSPNDFIRLTDQLVDRHIMLIQLLMYQDGRAQKLFRREHTATLLRDARGESGGSLDKIVAMSGDNGCTIAEVYDRDATHVQRDYANEWHTLLDWLRKESS